MKERILFWLPRIFGICAVLFMMMFSLDCIGEYTKWQQTLTCLVMNNIPAFLVLLCAYCMVYGPGRGIILIIASIAASIFFKAFAGNPWSLVVTMPFLLTGILFILHHRMYPKENSVDESDQE
ncbi:MAG: hypothetical protein IPH88_19745 [Bacteroidales bacterium]|nr:hypothetical protein [Bacteroidales bacterium]